MKVTAAADVSRPPTVAQTAAALNSDRGGGDMT